MKRLIIPPSPITRLSGPRQSPSLTGAVFFWLA